MNNSISVTISTLFTTLIINHYRLNSAYNGPILAVVLFLVNLFENDFKEYLTGNNILLGIIILVSIYYSTKLISLDMFKMYNDKNIQIITITKEEHLCLFERYFKNHLDRLFLNKNISYGYINQIIDDSIYHKNLSDKYVRCLNLVGPINERMEFIDEKYEMYGFITWKKKDTSIYDENKNVRVIPYIYIKLEIDIKKSNSNFTNYYNNICKDNIDFTNKENCIYFSKIIFNKNKNHFDKPYTNNTILINKEKKTSLEYKEKKYIHTFFHPKKNEIWNYIKKVHCEPDFFDSLGQVPQCNLLLHGPHGSGKSSLIQRISKTLDRYILSVDLRSVGNRQDVYNFMSHLEIRPYGNSQSSSIKLNKCIIVFEEFDITIDILSQKEKDRQEKNKLFIEYLKNKTENNIFLKDDEYNKDNKDNRDDKDNKDNKDDKYNKDDKKLISESFTIRDLLEILQGSFPMNDAIIIATSNKFDKMKIEYPALFRAGRLTPIYIGYLDRKNFNDLCNFYFDNVITDIDIPEQLNIPTSEIVESVMKSLIYNDKEKALIIFKEKIVQLLEKYP